MTEREYSMAELVERIDNATTTLSDKIDHVRDELSSDLTRVEKSLDAMKDRVVFSDLYEAHRVALEREINMKLAVMEAEMKSANERAASAELLARWALGILVAILATIIAIATGITPTP